MKRPRSAPGPTTRAAMLSLILLALPVPALDVFSPIHHPLLFNPIHHADLQPIVAPPSENRLEKRLGGSPTSHSDPPGTDKRSTSKKPLKVTNHCPDKIWPAITSQAGTGPGTGGFELDVGDTKSMTVSADWQGRVWGRTNCTFSSSPSSAGGTIIGGKACATGDCGPLSCVGAGEVPVTLAEFLLSSSSKQSFYDISLVDGYNLPIAIVLLPASPSTKDIPPNLTNPVCVGTAALLAAEGFSPYSSATTSVLGTNASFPLPFDQSQTYEQVSRWCPWSLQLSPPSKPGDGVYPYPDDNIKRPAFDPCFSACAKNNRPADCCTGSYNSPGACKPSLYSRNAKAVCPDAYSYAYDDQTSTFVVPEGAGFEVVFCPRARSTNILATKGPDLTRLSQQGAVKRSVEEIGVEGIEEEEGPLGKRTGAAARSAACPKKSLWGLVVALGYCMFGLL